MGSTRRHSPRNTLGPLACVQEGAGHQRLAGWSKAFSRPDSGKGIPGGGAAEGGHKVITIIGAITTLELGSVVHTQAIPFVQMVVVTPHTEAPEEKSRV